jgi:hypothetical protein
MSVRIPYYSSASVQQNILHTGSSQAKLLALGFFSIETYRENTFGGFRNFAKINHRDFLSGWVAAGSFRRV